MVEVEIDQQFPSEIRFIDEIGKPQEVRVVYDWLPTNCTVCKGIGHTADVCRRGGDAGSKKVWRPKAPASKPNQPKPVQPQKVVQQPQKGAPKQQRQKPVVVEASAVPFTPMVQRSGSLPNSAKMPEVEISMPRRILTRMMRGGTGERRLVTPGGLTFMESLTHSLQKSRALLIDKVNEKGIYGLLETRIRSRNMNKLNSSLCDEWAICTNNCSHGGGRIWLVWNPSMFSVNVLDITEQCIHSEVVDKIRKTHFWFTLVYGFNEYNSRDSLWHRLRLYHNDMQGAWLVGGDFNSIMAADERIGGAPVTRAEMRAMPMAICDCELYDLNSTGSFYTWNNKHEYEEKVYSRIDRVFINEEWLNLFPGSVAHFLPEGLYDHCPCVVRFDEAAIKRKASFKYYNMWSKAQGFEELITERWGMNVLGTEMYRIVTKLKCLKKDLKKLNREQFSDIENLAKVAEMSLDHLQTKLRVDPLNEDLCQAERECAKEVEFLGKARMDFLKQKAKMKWMTDGDDNSAFFHSSIKRRRARNTVYQIKDIRGVLCTTPDSIKSAFEEFYVSLLGDSKPVSPVKVNIVKQGKCLSQQHIELLLAPVSFQEV
ncbi:uncharacterized protein LOC141641139 [Silene latifolia]|uniref:uncharacterized protein LOC141641139 n=1 Tax=Silene latifolia TaxID=37657 RepID=UPI003D76A539